MKTLRVSNPSRIVACGIATLTLGSFAFAQAVGGASRVEPTLSAYKVSGGQLTPAKSIKPGETIEYQVRYTNNSAKSVSNVQAVLPIPSNLEYVPNSARPAGAQASIDGKRFAAMPLKRTIKAQDGTEKTVLVPTAEYRYLRWSIGSLGAGKDAQVAARAQLSTPSAP